MTDSESFPFIVEKFPSIAAYGSYSKTEIYSIENMADLVRFGEENGVFIVPEFDTPGHTRSWAEAPAFLYLNPCFNYWPKSLYLLYRYINS